jgi:hypothetical protein
MKFPSAISTAAFSIFRNLKETLMIIVLSYQQTVGSSSFNLGHHADTVIYSGTGTISINVVGNGPLNSLFKIAGLALEDPSAPPPPAPAVPEPSMMVIGMLFGIGGLMAKRRMKK